jgi:hypothetical protein
MTPHDDTGGGLSRRIDSRAEFVAALHEAVALALARRARRMLWVDADFAEWPLDDTTLLARLTQWLRLPQRQLVLLALHYDDVRRRARFVAWYRLWAHAVAAYSPAAEDAVALPCVLLAEGATSVQLVDPVHWRGWITASAVQERQWRERLDALLQRSMPAFAATTLGL